MRILVLCQPFDRTLAANHLNLQPNPLEALARYLLSSGGEECMKIFEGIFDNRVSGLTKALDLMQKRGEAISSNIANAETPGYRAADYNFAGELERAFGANTAEISTTNSKHFANSQTTSSAHTVEDLSGATKADGNNVDIDIQMGQMSLNAGKYSTAAQMLKKKMGILKMAIREGAR